MPEIRIDVANGREEFFEVFVAGSAGLLERGLAPEVGLGVDDLLGGECGAMMTASEKYEEQEKRELSCFLSPCGRGLG